MSTWKKNFESKLATIKDCLLDLEDSLESASDNVAGLDDIDISDLEEAVKDAKNWLNDTFNELTEDESEIDVEEDDDSEEEWDEEEGEEE